MTIFDYKLGIFLRCLIQTFPPTEVTATSILNEKQELKPLFSGRQKGGFVKGWFWRTYPRSGCRSGGSMRMYRVPPSGFRSGGTSECTSFRFSFRGNSRQNHPFGKQPPCPSFPFFEFLVFFLLARNSLFFLFVFVRLPFFSRELRVR